MQVLKDELRHRILLESEHLFLQRGYDRTSMQMIADKVNISKGNLYHYFKNKEELFYELTDSAAEGLKNLILRSRSGRFSNIADSREFQLLLQEEILRKNGDRYQTNIVLFTGAYEKRLSEKYGLLLIMEQGKGTRYEHLRPTMVALVAEQIEPLLADEENALLLAQIMADNLVGGIIQILKNRVRPREVRVCMNRLLDYHTKGIHALRVE